MIEWAAPAPDRFGAPRRLHSCDVAFTLVARQDERLLGLGATLVVRVRRQPDRLVAVRPAALAEERDALGFGLAAAALAHDVVDATQERRAAIGQRGAWLSCRRRMVGLSRKRAWDESSPASRDDRCLSDQKSLLERS